MVSKIIIFGIMGLMGIGIYCLLITRNLLKIIVALQVLIKGAMIAIIYAGDISGNMDLAQSMALTVIVADTIVAVVGLALSIQAREKTGSSTIQSISNLKK